MESTPPVFSIGRWFSDDVKFYAYKTSMGSEKLQPIHRYWQESGAGEFNDRFGHTCVLTIGMEHEKQPGWIYDKIVFYALPPEQYENSSLIHTI